MAKQVQYRGAAKSKGFSPMQVSDAAISRMREESNRVVEGMRQAAEADISQRQRISQEVKENQQYEKGAREKNFQIQTRNQETELRQIQLDSDTAAKNLEAEQKTQTDLFKSVANLSQTAAKKFEEIEQAKSDERAQQAINEFLVNPNEDEVIGQVLGEYELAATEEVRQSELDVLNAKGANPVAVSKSRSLDSNGRYKLDQARVNYILTNIYPQQLQKALLEAGELDSSQTAAFVTNFQREFFASTGVLNYKPEMLRDGLTALQGVNQGIQTKARELDLQIEQGIRIDNATTILTQNPAAFNQNIVSSFNTIVRANNGNYEKGYEWLQGLALLRDVNGEYLFTLDQIANATVNKGQPFAVSNRGRMGDIKMARERDDTQYRNAQIQADDLSFKEDTQKILAALTKDGSKANAESAIEFFRETYGKVPESIQQYANSYTHEAVAKAKTIEQYEAIPDGFITQEAVDALSGIDPTAAKTLAARFAAQQQKYTKGVFKDQSDSFKTIANGVTTFGSNKPNTPASLFLQGRMRAEYRKRVDQAVAGGMDFNTAAETIGMKLAAEVKDGARDKDSLWFRKPNQAGGSAEFPNLNQGTLPALEKAKRNYAKLKKDIYDRGLPAVLKTPGSIITKEEAVAIMNSYGKPGFIIPRDVAAVAGISNGADPFTIINAQLEALGLPPLDPPQITKDLNANVSPEFRSVIYDAKTRAAAKKRALEQGLSQTSGDTSVFRNSGSMRAGSPMRAFSGSRQQNAFIQTIRIVEGTSGAQGYNTVYGGAAVPQLTQMTLGELYDAIKLGGSDAIPARLGGGKIPFKKDRYNSSASGALQLMPETLRGLVERGGYNWDTIFSPETQNQMILDLANQGGVDIENMSPSQMAKAGNIWAGASRKYGQTNRTAADSYSIYQKLLQQ